MILELLVQKFYIFSGFLLISCLICSYFFTRFLIKFSKIHAIVDDPNLDKDRKKQAKAIPLFVGTGFCLVAIFAMLLLVLLSYFKIFNLNLFITEPNWAVKTIFVSVAVFLLLVGGLLDDLRKLRPIHQAFFVLFSVFLVVFGGQILIFNHNNSDLIVLLSKISNWLNRHDFVFLADFVKNLILNDEIANILNRTITFLWLVACISATKFLDGHDGLVGSIGLTGFLSIASIALFDHIQQPLLSLFALVWVCSLAGFLPFNFPNAKVYLGEGASYVIGFMIGVLSIMSSSKTLLGTTVIGLFVVDLMLVWTMRILQKRNPLTSADRLHWHHRLEQMGLNKVQVLVVTIFLTLFVTHLYFWFRDILGLWILFLELAVILILFLLWKFMRKCKK